MAEPLLRIEGLTKSFFGVEVLHGVGFTLEAGRVLGLVGENGSGKSTTMNILGGVHQPDGGAMWLADRPYQPRGPRDAAGNGIAFIHQELNLFKNLSIEENLFIGGFPKLVPGLPLIDRRRVRARTAELLKAVELDLPPSTMVSRLSQGERQLLEIAKALAQDARIVIFDEPTTSLTARESERLFALIGRLRQRGIAVIYISHILGDVMRLCDDVVVLRDGHLVGHASVAEMDVGRLITLMVGRRIDQIYPPRQPAVRPGTPVLEVAGLTQHGIVKDLDFTVRAGEVLGVAGLMGSGRSETARILFGLDPYQSGTIRVDGRPLDKPTPEASMEAGIAFLTEDRRVEGLLMEGAIADNIALPSLPRYATGWSRLVERTRLGDDVEKMGREVTINARDLVTTLAKNLSGGNQQKVVIGKWLLRGPRLFILDEPTRGIDVGAKEEIYALLEQLSAEGKAIIMISSELPEVLRMSHRIAVMAQGHITGFLDNAEATQENIMELATVGRAQLTGEVA